MTFEAVPPSNIPIQREVADGVVITIIHTKGIETIAYTK